jgi:hypothetical protein
MGYQRVFKNSEGDTSVIAGNPSLIKKKKINPTNRIAE